MRGVVFQVDPRVADRYASLLGLSRSAVPDAISRAIAASPFWSDRPGSTLLLAGATLEFALVGDFTSDDVERIRGLARAYVGRLGRMLYAGYARVEADCDLLAEALQQHFGTTALGELEFVAIPRGGLIVLGLLAYRLGLRHEQLRTCLQASQHPVVVVDDCAFTGARYCRFAESLPQRPVVFAPLYSHPDFRLAIVGHQHNVVACLSAQDLPTRPSATDGPEPLSRLRSLLAGERCWLGYTDIVFFPWNEPTIHVMHPDSDALDRLWYLLPPELCAKNRPPAGQRSIAVHLQQEFSGRFRPAKGVMTTMRRPAGEDCRGDESLEQTVIVQVETEQVWGLSGVAADMWHLLLCSGSKLEVVDALRRRYHVDEVALTRDLDQFVQQLTGAGLLVTTDVASG